MSSIAIGVRVTLQKQSKATHKVTTVRGVVVEASKAPGYWYVQEEGSCLRHLRQTSELTPA